MELARVPSLDRNSGESHYGHSTTYFRVKNRANVTIRFELSKSRLRILQSNLGASGQRRKTQPNRPQHLRAAAVGFDRVGMLSNFRTSRPAETCQVDFPSTCNDGKDPEAGPSALAILGDTAKPAILGDTAKRRGSFSSLLIVPILPESLIMDSTYC